MNTGQNPMLTFDTHVDIPWPVQNDGASSSTHRRFDLEKARRGQLKAVCLAAYVPQGLLDEGGHTAAFERACAMLSVITALDGTTSGFPVRLCRTAEALKASGNAEGLAIVPVIENGYALGTDVRRVEWFARTFGVRYITLTHNGHNLLADSAVPRADLGNPPAWHGGLSDLGRRAIAVMNRHGVVVDVSHASKAAMMQACDASQAPVVASHSCVRRLCDHPRNLDDEQLDRLRDTGGVIQITAMGRFLKQDGGGTLDDLIRHICYVAETIGSEHVGISSDFDGGGGIAGWQDASQTQDVTRALEREGFHAQDIAAIWGGNMIRLLETAERISVT